LEGPTSREPSVSLLD
jgi:hypothetical protein